MNSDSIVDFPIKVYLVDFQDTTLSITVNTYPLVDLLSLMFETQLVSQYPSNIIGNMV